MYKMHYVYSKQNNIFKKTNSHLTTTEMTQAVIYISGQAGKVRPLGFEEIGQWGLQDHI